MREKLKDIDFNIRWWWRSHLDGQPWRWLAYRLPQRLVFWVLIRAGVQHIHTDEVVPEVPFMDVLKRAG